MWYSIWVKNISFIVYISMVLEDILICQSVKNCCKICCRTSHKDVPLIFLLHGLAITFIVRYGTWVWNNSLFCTYFNVFGGYIDVNLLQTVAKYVAGLFFRTWQSLSLCDIAHEGKMIAFVVYKSMFLGVILMSICSKNLLQIMLQDVS